MLAFLELICPFLVLFALDRFRNRIGDLGIRFCLLCNNIANGEMVSPLLFLLDKFLHCIGFLVVGIAWIDVVISAGEQGRKPLVSHINPKIVHFFSDSCFIVLFLFLPLFLFGTSRCFSLNNILVIEMFLIII